MKITFWTPGHAPADDGKTFGCASHGIAATDCWCDPAADQVVVAPAEIAGETVAGSYAEVLEKLGRVSVKPAAAIILFARAAGMEDFLNRWHGMFPGVPVAGGGAARGPGQEQGELCPPASDVAVLLITEGRWRAESLNVHEALETNLEFEAAGPRSLVRLRRAGEGEWQPAAAFFADCQRRNGRDACDCESITLSDPAGRNVHVSVNGDVLPTGADLPAGGRLVLRAVTREQTAASLGAFCSPAGALVFGCAGLRSLLDAPLTVPQGSLATFLFGELVTLDGRPQFGNLMASRLLRED